MTVPEAVRTYWCYPNKVNRNRNGRPGQRTVGLPEPISFSLGLSLLQQWPARCDSGNATRGLINNHAVSAKPERRDHREPRAAFERRIFQNAERFYRGVAAHDLSREVPKGGAAAVR